MAVVVWENARIFTSSTSEVDARAVAFSEGRVVAVGETAEVYRAVPYVDEVTDLEGAFVMPGIIESHTHLVMFGQSLSKVQLRGCGSIKEIQSRIQEARNKLPEGRPLLGVGWQIEALGGAMPTATMIDEVVDDVPVLLDSHDLHSTWVNSAALKAMEITSCVPNPVGGQIVRDSNGQATGYLIETAAMQYAWGWVAGSMTEADRDSYLRAAFNAYCRAGVTGATEMALSDLDLEAFERILTAEGQLPFPVTAYYLVQPSANINEDRLKIDRVWDVRARMRDRFGEGSFRIAGIKFIVDGVIDSCTAALHQPYVNGEMPPPIWGRNELIQAVLHADALGLQVALHAIGDAASELALDAIESCFHENGQREDRRPRIEHLETVSEESVERMARLGVVASMQPVHSDPAIMENWKAVLGFPRSEEGFAWQKFRDAGVMVVLGTDAPTAPHYALQNLYIALTGASAIDLDLPPYHDERVFEPHKALLAVTKNAAWASSMPSPVIEPGAPANLIALDVNPLVDPAGSLLDARVVKMVIKGQEIELEN